MKNKIMLLGSGELGKEFVIAAQRLGRTVIAVDSYAGAPAMQVADASEVIDMLDGKALDAIVAQHAPEVIVPEIEAIRTERFYDYEERGIQVVPSAKAANFTMNRRAIRDLAAKDLGLPTAKYGYASSLEELKSTITEVGIPCVVKPLMSSSGKGQSTVRNVTEIEKAWTSAADKGRGDSGTVIAESFVDFTSEITLLTVTQKNGPTLFCAPIGHRQERGDYQESWQPALIRQDDVQSAKAMAAKVTEALGGAGIWGVEFFITDQGVIFSELSPRPHDTGMVTLANTQNFNEFELHCRAVLGLPIPEITQDRVGASAVILADANGTVDSYQGLQKAASEAQCDLRIFGKETGRPNRRMGVVVTNDVIESNPLDVAERAKVIAGKVKVVLK